MPRKFLRRIDNKLQKIHADDHSKALFILHDQLNLSAFPEWVKEEKPLLIFIESREKGNELPHHMMKAVYVLSAMRHFALKCSEAGYPVLYHSTSLHFEMG